MTTVTTPVLSITLFLSPRGLIIGCDVSQAKSEHRKILLFGYGRDVLVSLKVNDFVRETLPSYAVNTIAELC